MATLLTGSVRQGPMADRFAGEIKELLGRRFAVPVSRGREAIWLALRALNVGASDEVILPSYVCASVLDAVIQAGANPVFADIDESLHVTARSVERAITAKTRCAIIPHLFGNTAPVDKIEAMLRTRRIALIDDAAQSLGARRSGRPIGSFGEFGVVCGGPAKPLAGPAGGLLLTDDPDFYANALRNRLQSEGTSLVLRRMLAFWFWRRFRRYTILLGIVAERLRGSGPEPPACEPRTASNLDAAVLCDQLDRLPETRQKREHVARQLEQVLQPLSWRVINDLGPDAIPLKLVVLLPDNGPELQTAVKELASAGIECQGGYTPCHWNVRVSEGIQLQNTEALWARVLCFPIERPLKDTRPLIRFVQMWSREASKEHLSASKS